MLFGVVLSTVLVVVASRELDPAACSARFDVQRDKIIRTEESREMGARYLSELDVGSRHECRRLCCETEACDVFVYEEKSPGSCYLFNCGPPEDFRCKFTTHGNFSSGVLALSRRLAELQDQERLPPPPAPAAPPLPHHVSPTTTTFAPPPPPPPTRPPVTAPPSTPPFTAPTHTTQKPKRHCSRYQWECHSGDECIAVYNACDGIPQCADGSDEAPELGCPAPAPPARPSPPPAPLQPAYPAQMYESGAGADAVAGAGGGERWPHRLLQAQPRRYPVTESAGPHIFSHKGGLVQEEPAPAFEPPAPPPQPWPRRPSWAAHQGIESSGWGGWGRDWTDEHRAWPAPPAPVQPELPPYLGPKTMPEMPLLYPQQHSLHDAPKKGLGLELEAGPAPAPAPPAPPATAPARAASPDNTTKKKAGAVQPEVKESSGSSSAHVTAVPVVRGPGAEAHTDDHDGLSEHPPAAIMLLVLGVLMTGAMGVMVGCRARAARRRLRRGGRLAHDADYLVNGMYL